VGVYGGPDLSESGLVLAFDGANYKSFKGEATINLIPSPTINAYPTTGNGWGTYNTNQYGSGNYFSIGTVSNVTNNIITMTSAHSLRTYDVMQPQTSGGGVTAGTNYFIKKVSDTSFTLHEYNGSQDGSQGYINPSTGTHKVYDSIATDTRISVNSTNFPTMWWGYPHLPNSGLVKELRYGEFNAIPNLPANDCIRLHYIRTDDVKDGMSYGVDCTVTAGSPVTISFYTRAANANAVGKVIQYYIYNFGASATAYAWNFTLGALGVWERQTFTYTPAYGTMISYWFPQSSGVYSWDWSCMQVEQKSYVTNFVAGTRGTTVATGGGWADLTGAGNNGELVNGVRESSDNLGALVFDGSDDYVNIGTFFNYTNFTISLWVYPGSTQVQYADIFDNNHTGNQNFVCQQNVSNTNQYSFACLNATNASGTGLFTLTANTWTFLTFTWNNSVASAYINGVFHSSGSAANPINYSSQYLRLGTWGGGGRNWNGRMSNFVAHNRVLTAAEIQQNFNANRSRFGI
jgi:hypothetical protein